MILMNDEPMTWLKAVIYGDTGTGKTSFGVTAPKPLFLLTERNGRVHIIDAAKRLGLPTPPTILMSSLDDYRAVLRAMKSPRTEFKVALEDGTVIFEGDRPETIVLDTVTDAMQQFVIGEVHAEAKPRKASDGLDDITRRHWNAYRNKGTQFLRWWRDVDAHTIFLCQRDERGGEEEKSEVKVVPAMPMKSLTQFLTQSCSVVGITTRAYGEKSKDSDRSIIYAVRTVAPENYVTKPLRPLRDVEDPNFTSWVERTCVAQRKEVA